MIRQPTAPDFTAQADFAVQVEGLTRRFRGKVALQSVDLQIPVGSIFGLIGLNGAGKTTLIRHLIGSLKAQHGRVAVLGDDPVRNPEGVLKQVGYLTEEDSLPKWMRIGDLIDFSRGVYPTWDDAYAKQLCETFSLTRATRLQSLSKGQRARAGLLVAIAHRPELLILDEPSSGLDPIARSDILEAIIRTISEDGRTVLFSSHLLEEVDRVCDSVALMHEGRIIESLKTEQLEIRYGEILCRVDSDQGSTPGVVDSPEVDGAFGWRLSGQEWSAVVERSEFNEAALPAEFSLIDRREITLSRWFAARVGASADSMQESSSNREVIADA